MKKRIGLIVLMIVLIGAGLVFYNKIKVKEIYNSISIEFVENVKVEYGKKVDAMDFVKPYSDDLMIVFNQIDTSSIGNKEVDYFVKKDGIEKKFTLSYEVLDTCKPEIKLKHNSVTIKISEQVNILDYVSYVKDAIDGELTYKDYPNDTDNNYYTFTTDLNPSKAGTYAVEFVAVDKNYNKTTKTMTIKVEKEEEDNHDTTSYNPDFVIHKKKIIVINAGHQAKGNNAKEAVGPNSSTTKAKVTTGATGKYSKEKESQINLDVALKLRDELVSRGYTVYMIRTSQNVNISNQQRALKANGYKPAAVISLHCDSADNESARGAHTIAIKKDNPYCSPLYDASSKLAKSVINAYCKETGIKSRGVSYRNDLTGLNWSTVPSIYLEMGFLSNQEEDLSLANSDFQYKCAKGIANGIDQYLK